LLGKEFVIIAGNLMSLKGDLGQKGNEIIKPGARDSQKLSKSYAFEGRMEVLLFPVLAKPIFLSGVRSLP
jgi:hypothetical protein